MTLNSTVIAPPIQRLRHFGAAQVAWLRFERETSFWLSSSVGRRANKPLDRSANSELLIDNLRVAALRARPVNSTLGVVARRMKVHANSI